MLSKLKINNSGAFNGLKILNNLNHTSFHEADTNENKRSKTPTDFELVFDEGIHPFYLGMEADQVMEAATGWKISSSERDNGGIQLPFEKSRRIIEVSLVNSVWFYPGFYANYRTYYIWTEDAQFADDKSLSKMENSSILSRFIGDHALRLDPEYEGAVLGPYAHGD